MIPIWEALSQSCVHVYVRFSLNALTNTLAGLFYRHRRFVDAETEKREFSLHEGELACLAARAFGSSV